MGLTTLCLTFGVSSTTCFWSGVSREVDGEVLFSFCCSNSSSVLRVLLWFYLSVDLSSTHRPSVLCLYCFSFADNAASGE